MPNIREMLNKSPWIGWAVAGAAILLAVLIIWRRSAGEDLYTPDRMKEMVTVKFADTGDEMQMPRGRLDKELRLRDGLVDPKLGVINPKSGLPTGFLVDKEWDKMIERINADKKAAGLVKTSAPKAPGAPSAPAAPAAPSAPPK